MGEFTMPALGAGMDVGRIIEWYVSPGDEVSRGGVIAKVETDKANIDVEVFEDGVVEELLVEAGAKVPVGTPLARIATNGAATEVTEATEEAGEPEPEAAVAPEAEAAEPEPDEDGPFVTSPLVRRQAEETGVDLTTVRGSGPGGVITRRDVAEVAEARAPTHEPAVPASPAASDDASAAAAAAAPSPSAAPSTAPPAGTRSSPYARRLADERGIDPASLAGSGPGDVLVARDIPPAAGRDGQGPAAPAAEEPAATAAREPAAPAAADRDDRALAMRQAIARAMERSNREIPHYYLGETVDVERTLEWLAEVNADRPPTARILPAVLVLKATALALTKYPDLNGYWIDDAFQPGDGIHIGVAINLRRGGLLAPAIRNVDQRSLDELMDALRDLVERTRAAGLKGSEMTDPTITVSNLGDTGVETIQGVITPPQVALVGVGRITERPWAVDGMLAVRRTMQVSLAGDHRASDGHRGGRFLGAIATNLTRPEKL